MKKIVLRAKHASKDFKEELSFFTNADKSFISDGNWALSTDLVDLEKTFSSLEKLKRGASVRETRSCQNVSLKELYYRNDFKEAGVLGNPTLLRDTDNPELRYVRFTLSNGRYIYINADFYEIFESFELRGGISPKEPIGAYKDNKLCGVIMPIEYIGNNLVEVQNIKKCRNSYFALFQTDRYLSKHSRVFFGVFDSYDKAFTAASKNKLFVEDAKVDIVETRLNEFEEL